LVLRIDFFKDDKIQMFQNEIHFFLVFQVKKIKIHFSKACAVFRIMSAFDEIEEFSMYDEIEELLYQQPALTYAIASFGSERELIGRIANKGEIEYLLSNDQNLISQFTKGYIRKFHHRKFHRNWTTIFYAGHLGLLLGLMLC
jgi:hypothetical protein